MNKGDPNDDYYWFLEDEPEAVRLLADRLLAGIDPHVQGGVYGWSWRDAGDDGFAAEDEDLPFSDELAEDWE